MKNKIFEKVKKSCPVCKTRIDIDGRAVGDEIQCPNCESDVIIDYIKYKPILTLLQINIVGL